jgi:hypothetical protein
MRRTGELTFDGGAVGFLLCLPAPSPEFSGGKKADLKEDLKKRTQFVVTYCGEMALV